MRYPACLLALLLTNSFCIQAQRGNENLRQTIDSLIINAQYAEALSRLEQFSDESSSILLDNMKAETLTRSGKLDQAEKVLSDLQIRLTLHPDAFLNAVVQSNWGYLQLNKGRSDLAELSLQNALRFFEDSDQAGTTDAAKALSYLGLVYMSQGKYTQAQEQMHRAMSLRQENSENNKGLIAASLNDLGLVYSQTDKDRALNYYGQALEMYLTLYQDNDPRIAIANINIGIIYRDLQLYGDAVNNFETALRIWNSNFSQPHPTKAIALYNLGQTYIMLNDSKAAMQYYEQALKMYSDYFGPKHPEAVSVLNAIGNLQVADAEFNAALLTYQEALQANVQDFTSHDPAINPSLEKYYNGSRLLHTLLFKAQAYEARYNGRSLKFSDLKEALSVLAICDTLIDVLRQHTSNESDKMLLGAIASEVYADGVRIAHLAAINALKKESFFEKAFYFAEKSKSAVLLETISDANAKSFAGIPSELLDEEKNLKSAIALNARKLAEKPSPEEEGSLRERSFNLMRRYNAFIRKLETDYPDYFNLKFNTELPSIAQIQSMLNDSTGVLSYFIDDKNNHVYIFLIYKQQYRVWQRAIARDFDKYITGIRNGLYFQEINTFKKSAYTLGRTLIPPLPSPITDLVILPTGRLGLIPFETLLTDDPQKINDYSEMPYLLRRLNIRYEFCAGLMVQKSRKVASPAGTSIMLCAPVNFPDRKYLGELPGTETEVQTISQLFSERNLKSVSLTRLDAGEVEIKRGHLKDFAFLHFATHGVVDEASPELSRIFLRAGQEEDGNLYAGEIYNLDLNANLVTLSACQTGMGKVMRGEGVIGLSRALVYAGARHIIVSFWNVADESTANLMEDFYRNLLLSQGTGYGFALRQSKVRLMQDPKFSAPFYWAPFVLIGF